MQVGDLVAVDARNVGLWRRYYAEKVGLVTYVATNKVATVQFAGDGEAHFGFEELRVINASR
jgi:hypothetical protein|tara:strand:- start:426 stop:611 length:186 start_codon:yes stop_codon:yes gene_type:complete